MASWCVIAGVGIELHTPGVGELSEVVRVLREWQHTVTELPSPKRAG